MLVPIALLLLATPDWAAGLEFESPPPEVRAAPGPGQIAISNEGSEVAFEVTGPCELKLSVAAVVPPRSRQKIPIAFSVFLDDQRTDLVLSPRPHKRWRLRIKGQAKTSLAAPTRWTLQIPEGTHQVVLASTKRLPFAWWAKIADAPSTDVDLLDAPAIPEGPQDDEEPALLGAETDGPSLGDDQETQAIDNEAHTPTSPLSSGFVFKGPTPTPTNVKAGSKNEPFVRFDIDRPLSLTVIGPGTLSLSLHGLIDPTQTDTTETTVLAVMRDDILVQTVAIPAIVSPEFSSPVAPQLSNRLLFEMGVAAGVHQIEISPSENALLGALAQVSFAAGEPTSTPHLYAEAPSELSQRSAPPPPLPQGAVRAFVSAGTWFPAGLSSPGVMLTVGAGLRLPFESPDLGLSFTATFLHAQRSLGFTSASLPLENSRVVQTLKAAPLLLRLRWFAFDIGDFRLGSAVAGGVALVWPQVTFGGRGGQTHFTAKPAFEATAEVRWKLGPGGLLLRAGAFFTSDLSNPSSQNISLSGPLIQLGYDLEVTP